MKAIIGIDAQGAYKPALHLYRNLGFQNAATTLVHAASAVLPMVPVSFLASMEVQTDYARVVENVGRTALEDAKSYACGLDINCKTRLVLGSPADVLCHTAEASQADLVAVSATHHGKWSSSFLGSVSRSLAIACPASVLIAKDPEPTPRRLNVVLAVDHSEYCMKAVGHFLSMRAVGIDKIHVVTAFDMRESDIAAVSVNLPSIQEKIVPWVTAKLRKKNEDLCAHLKEWGYEADQRIVSGPTNDVLREAMQDMQADLMIMGAQGHGFFERLMIGSTSLHQAVAEPYPVFIIRG
jgi:nucleotide-binding universal stress UspA family protein